MTQKFGVSVKLAVVAIAVFLGIIALRPFFEPAVTAQAQSARFDHVLIVSTGFLYKGRPGLLLLDKRNGNVWFIQRSNDESAEPFQDPVFLIRMQFEKLDQAPR